MNNSDILSTNLIRNPVLSKYVLINEQGMKTFEHRKNPDSSSFGHFAYFCSVKTNDHIRKAMQDRILLLDGAMGTMLQQRGQSGNFDHLNLTAPDLVADIHRTYI